MEQESAAAPAPRKRRWLRALVVVLALVAVALGVAVAWLASESALVRALAELSARSGGTLTFEGVTGSLFSDMRVQRIVYRDAHVEVVATDVAIAWSPSALPSRVVHIRRLAAQRIGVTLAPSSEPASLPASLALPIELRIDEAAVARLDVKSGDVERGIDDVRFGYAGGATAHRLTGVALASEWGRLGGDASLAAIAPFALDGALAVTASEKLARATANVTLGGDLSAVDIKFDVRAHDATARGGATIAPFAPMPVVAATITARDVDVDQFDAALPSMRITAKIDAKGEAAGRFVGTLEASNAAPGTIDANRLPLSAITTRFAISRERLELDDIVADFGAGGRASGRGRIELASSATLPPSEWELAVRELDLSRFHRRAIATKLGGHLRAHVERGRQHVDADLAQGDRALAFVATIKGDDIDVERFRARAGTGDAAGHGKLSLAGARAFTIAATTTRFDPSRFFVSPPASLDGTIDASGQLGAPWNADGRITLQPTSRFAGISASGSARARVSAQAIADASVEAKLGDASVRANGNFGKPDDALVFDVDVPRVATLAPLMGSRWPDGLAGKWRAHGTLRGSADAPGLELTARAERLTYEADALGTLDVRAAIAAPRESTGAFSRLNERPLTIAIAATDLRAPDAHYASAAFAIDGTLAQHVATLSVTGDDIDASARLAGGFAPTSTIAAPSWSGELGEFDNRGAYAMHLQAPARLSWARDRVELGDAAIAIADGVFRVAAFSFRDGRIDTRGAFNGVPAAAIAGIAGTPLPMRSTLVLGGEWNVSAAPRLNGSVRVRRESGDLFAGAGVLSSGEIALRLEALELAATVANDTIDASATMRAASLGRASATLRVGNVAGASAGAIPPDAPVVATLDADVSTLAPLQPLLGTSAIVDGRIAVHGDAKGTRRNLALSGSMVASDVKLAAPQYGVHWTNGRVRARLADGALTLDELSLDGGDGRFVANGTLVGFQRGGAANAATTSVTWRAERFRATNRPDMRLIVDGSGTLGETQGRLLLKGNLTAREGHFEIAHTSPYTLGPDVVVAGVRREPPPERFHNVPLAVDLDLDLGDRLDVVGRGIDARIAGRVHVATTAGRDLTARGTIRTVSGTYDAFGQRLTIQRGRLIFDGPIDNPALDIVAVRRNLPVEAGVEVTGSVNLPRVVLVSDPPVPDGEKLSWLVLGQGLDRTSGADAAALQAAAATLFGGNGAPIGTTLARKIGLDDISLRAATNATTSTGTAGSPLGGQVLAVSKRLSDKLYIIYEQGLSVANNALKIEYVLTRNLTLRGEAGTVSGVGIYYQRSFE